MKTWGSCLLCGGGIRGATGSLSLAVILSHFPMRWSLVSNCFTSGPGLLHLGPLAPAETRKLVWRLPGLDALKPNELRRAYEEVGGHPRALEYLDALLRGGKARFPDVEQRLKKALEKKNITDPGR